VRLTWAGTGHAQIRLICALHLGDAEKLTSAQIGSARGTISGLSTLRDQLPQRRLTLPGREWLGAKRPCRPTGCPGVRRRASASRHERALSRQSPDAYLCMMVGFSAVELMGSRPQEGSDLRSPTRRSVWIRQPQ
jgi:hypothetical protein